MGDAAQEYSLHICGLRKLFPNALFIHILRDVTSVIRSILHFHHVNGQDLVANTQEAYTYWLKTVSKCLLAERVYGPQVVFRPRHSDLVAKTRSDHTIAFSFLVEPFAPECLEPLVQRVNSSNVPADFEIDLRGTDLSLVEQVMRLSQQLDQSLQPTKSCLAAIKEIRGWI